MTDVAAHHHGDAAVLLLMLARAAAARARARASLLLPFEGPRRMVTQVCYIGRIG